VDANESQPSKAPPTTVIIGGVYLEGARWDQSKKMLAESLPKIHYDLLPAIR